MSEKAIGDEGYLTDKGLIPMPKQERQQFQQSVNELMPLAGLDE